jgi:lactate dehydrogenase-like 2-hydroxyacid dehydrogenase
MITSELLAMSSEHAPRLNVVSTISVSYDNFDVPALTGWACSLPSWPTL